MLSKAFKCFVVDVVCVLYVGFVEYIFYCVFHAVRSVFFVVVVVVVLVVRKFCCFYGVYLLYLVLCVYLLCCDTILVVTPAFRSITCHVWDMFKKLMTSYTQTRNMFFVCLFLLELSLYLLRVNIHVDMKICI